MAEAERLTNIIGQMVHGGVNARRTLSRGLIISYFTPEPDTPREQQRYVLSAARLNVWPDDQELKVVYDATSWTRREVQTRRGVVGSFVIYWRQWPVREVFVAPANLQETLRAALARRR